MRDKHKRTVEELTQVLVEQLKSQLHSIVVFGSVARGTAREDSDIDLLVILSSNDENRDKIFSLACDVDMKNKTVTIPRDLFPEEVEELVRLGSPFIEDVLREGIVTYDDGTFERVRQRVFASGG